MSDNWWDAREQVKKECREHGKHAALDLLMAINKSHGDKRCTGMLVIDGDGIPTLSFCGRWQCWKCQSLCVHNNTARVVSHAVKSQENGARLWSVTVVRTDAAAAENADTMQELSSTMRSVMNIWQGKARRQRQALGYGCYFGLKKSTRQLHAHVLCDFLPDAVPAPTPGYPTRHTSQWLSDALAGYGLACFIVELVGYADIVRMAEYTANNTLSLLRSDLPTYFRAMNHSRRWRKLDRTPRNAHVWACDACSQMSWSGQRRAPTRCRVCGSHEHSFLYTVKGYSNIALNALPYIYTHNNVNAAPKTVPLTPTRSCSQCGVVKPLTTDNFQQSGNGRFRSECKQCSGRYEQARERKPTRRHRRDKMTDAQWFSELASEGIEHKDMPDDMPIQRSLALDT